MRSEVKLLRVDVIPGQSPMTGSYERNKGQLARPGQLDRKGKPKSEFFLRM
jgi:hypothetical protein